MRRLRHNLVAAVFIAGVYAAAWAGRRRWGPWAAMPTEGSRASRRVEWFAGVVLWQSFAA